MGLSAGHVTVLANEVKQTLITLQVLKGKTTYDMIHHSF